MTDSPGGVPPTITLDLGGHRVALDVDVPDSPATARVALPLARAAADAATAHAGPVSCGPGCAACCRELVPVAEPEAFALAAVVEAMPEPRRTAVRERFAAAAQRAVQGGLLQALRPPGPDQSGRPSASDLYFSLKIDCPFLEAESCSVYEDRPLVCREHLVSSPPEECRRPAAGGVRKVELPIPSPFRALAATATGRGVGDAVPWVPLALVLAWTAKRTEPAPTRTGPEWVEELAARLTGGRHAA